MRAMFCDITYWIESHDGDDNWCVFNHRGHEKYTEFKYAMLAYHELKKSYPSLHFRVIKQILSRDIMDEYNGKENK